jgi:hypothetical protein
MDNVGHLIVTMSVYYYYYHHHHHHQPQPRAILGVVEHPGYGLFHQETVARLRQVILKRVYKGGNVVK